MAARTTSHTLLGAALALPAAPAPAEAFQHENEWQELEQWAAGLHRDGAAVVQRAHAAGLDIEAYSGLWLGRDANGRGQLVLSFGDWKPGTSVVQVSMAGVLRGDMF